MRLPTKAPLALAVAAAVAIGGCGGGDEEATTSSTQPQSTTTRDQNGSAQTRAAKSKGNDRRDSSSSKGGETATQGSPAPTGPPPTSTASLPNEGTKRPAPGVPTHKGDDNSVQTYGTEAPVARRIDAALALQAYLDARADKDWAGACVYLSASVQKLLEKFAERIPKSRGAGCAEVIGALAQGAPRAALKAEARIEVISLRVEGDSAFVIYESPDDRVSTTPMTREDGAWKVSGMGSTPLG